MMKETTYYQQLLQRYIRNRCTPLEAEELLDHLRENAATRLLLRQMRDDYNQMLSSTDLPPVQGSEEMRQTLVSHTKKSKGRVAWLYKARFWPAAASVILLLAAGTYYWSSSRTYSTQKNQESVARQDKTPGKEGAILTLADGTQVVLDSLESGIIATQNGTEIALKDGQVVYAPGSSGDDEIAYNTMTTPKGRQFRVLLPDGTKVWLNAASSLTYPTVFADKERKVRITGEAYFEVAKNAGVPFLVDVSNQAEIQVLGTHFNVYAYAGEPNINTTLLEGSIRVVLSKDNGEVAAGQGEQVQRSVILEPGQQARVNIGATSIPDQSSPSHGRTIRLIKNADIEKIMAWKNGLFNFDDKSLQEAMQQLERWYDIQVVYENGVPDIPFGGEISRNLSLASLLKIFAGTDLKFRIEGDGKRLVISK